MLPRCWTELHYGLILLLCNLTIYVVDGFIIHSQPAILYTHSSLTTLGSPCVKTITATSLSSLFVRRTKWDDLVDEDEADDGGIGYLKDDVRPDMRYEPHNIKRQLENFAAIRQVAGKDMCNDIYVRETNSEVFWYVGKTARISDISVEQCVARQWPLIELHAANLRPIELFPNRGKLEIWTAPGDTELDVAYNRPTLIMTQMQRVGVDGSDDVKSNFIGFQGEVYERGEEGFRTWRTDDGKPARPEINPGGETRPPTQEELEQLQKELSQHEGSED